MKVLASQFVTSTTYTGQTPASLVPVVTTAWNATIIDDDGAVRQLTGLPFDPMVGANAAQLYATAAPAVTIPPVTKADWARAMNADYLTWLRWKTTHTEATARGVAANIITALTAQENAAWNAYANDVLAWNSAT